MIRTFANASKTKEVLESWLDEWVFSVKSHEEYLNKVGAVNLITLQANSHLKYSTRVKRGSK